MFSFRTFSHKFPPQYLESDFMKMVAGKLFRVFMVTPAVTDYIDWDLPIQSLNINNNNNVVVPPKNPRTVLSLLEVFHLFSRFSLFQSKNKRATLPFRVKVIYNKKPKFVTINSYRYHEILSTVMKRFPKSVTSNDDTANIKLFVNKVEMKEVRKK
jgi:hypothetical protein